MKEGWRLEGDGRGVEIGRGRKRGGDVKDTEEGGE